MLSIYPPAVLDRAVSPSRGLAAYIAYPNLAKFRELLEQWHTEHIEDMRRRGELRQARPAPLRLLPPPNAGLSPPGGLANVFVPAGHPRYGELVSWAKTADERKWRFGKSSDGRAGLWVSFDVWDARQSVGRSVGNLAADVVRDAAE